MLLDQFTQPPALDPALIEILEAQPGAIGRPCGGPFVIDEGIPGGVAVASLVDERLAEDALEAEAQTLGRSAGARVQGIAFPFVAPVVQFIEGPGQHEEHGLGGGGRALQGGAEVQVPHLDTSRFGLNPEITGHPHRAMG